MPVYDCSKLKLIFLPLVLLGLLQFFTLVDAAELPIVIDRIKPGIVGVGTFQQTRSPRAHLLGTGFVVANGQYVVTNLHVVSQMLDDAHFEHYVVFVGRGPAPKVRKADILAEDPAHDLAILEIPGVPLSALQLGDSGQVREGQLYAFTGFPIGAVLGLYPVTHRGIVSSITPIVAPMDRSTQLTPEVIKRLRSPYNVFQLDATAYPGNSGSPLYDPETGKVIAVVNMVFVKGTKESVLKDPSGITYAMPARYVRALMQSAGITEP